MNKHLGEHNDLLQPDIFIQESGLKNTGDKATDVARRASVVEGFRSAWTGEYADPRLATATLAEDLGVEGRADIDSLLAAAENATERLSRAEPSLDVAPRSSGLFASEDDETDDGMYRERIPAESVARPHDTVKDILRRVVEANREKFGYQGSSDIAFDAKAMLLATKIAESNGCLKYWVTDEGAGKFSVIPEKIGDDWELAFVDVSGKRMSLEEVEAAGYLVKLKR